MHVFTTDQSEANSLSFSAGAHKGPSVWKRQSPDQLPHGQQTAHRVSWE